MENFSVFDLIGAIVGIFVIVWGILVIYKPLPMEEGTPDPKIDEETITEFTKE